MKGKEGASRQEIDAELTGYQKGSGTIIVWEGGRKKKGMLTRGQANSTQSKLQVCRHKCIFASTRLAENARPAELVSACIDSLNQSQPGMSRSSFDGSSSIPSRCVNVWVQIKPASQPAGRPLTFEATGSSTECSVLLTTCIQYLRAGPIARGSPEILFAGPVLYCTVQYHRLYHK